MKVVTNMTAASTAFIVVLLRTSRDDVVKWMFMKPCPNAKMDPIELAAIFHTRFELIHPFLDFNGHVGRHILNLMLIREGFPAIYFMPNQRTIYLNAIREADFFNYRNIVEFVIKRMFICYLYPLSFKFFKLWKS